MLEVHKILQYGPIMHHGFWRVRPKKSGPERRLADSLSGKINPENLNIFRLFFRDLGQTSPPPRSDLPKIPEKKTRKKCTCSSRVSLDYHAKYARLAAGRPVSFVCTCARKAVRSLRRFCFCPLNLFGFEDKDRSSPHLIEEILR